MEVCSPTQVQSLKVQGFDINKKIHLLYCRLELINLDVAACTEEIAVLDDLVDHFILMIELLIKFFYSEHLNCFLQVRQCIKVISMIIIFYCKFLILLSLINLLLLVKGDFRAEQTVPIVFWHLSWYVLLELALDRDWSSLPCRNLLIWNLALFFCILSILINGWSMTRLDLLCEWWLCFASRIYIWRGDEIAEFWWLFL